MRATYSLEYKVGYFPFSVLIFCVFLACIGLVACDDPPEPDRSYLENNPCDAPCWQKITPGITGESNAVAILSNLDLIDQDTLKCDDHSGNLSLNGCTFRRISNEGGVVGFEDGIVQVIQLNSDVTLGKAITAFGEPDFIVASEGVEDEHDDVGKCYRADVYYLRGIFLLVRGCESYGSPYGISSENDLIVSPDMEVDGVRFFQLANDERKMLINSSGQLDIERHYLRLQPWLDFKAYPILSNE
jgi:hypothetical protein